MYQCLNIHGYLFISKEYNLSTKSEIKIVIFIADRTSENVMISGINFVKLI